MPKTCFYDLLDIRTTANEKEIAKAYRKAALKWHPDRNAGCEDAAEKFKEVQEAYEILKNPQERAWYDENMDDLLRSDDEEVEAEEDKEYGPEAEPELDDNWFSRDGFTDFSDGEDNFFEVYHDFFQNLHEQEQTARDGDHYRPGFGDHASQAEVVVAFYSYWLNFNSCRSFASHDKWVVSDAPSRIVRKLMEQKNKNERDKGRKAFNERVRQLVVWVQSLDPRAGAESVNAKATATIDSDDEEEKTKEEIFNCAACNKRFKSAQQMSNHEKSTKHKQAVAKLQKQLEELDDGLKELAVEEEGSEDEEEKKEKEARKKERRRKKNKQSEEAEPTAEEEEDFSGVAVEWSPQDILLQSREAFEATEDFKKMNKTQRRKAIQQWEAENEFARQNAPKTEKKAPAPVGPTKIQKRNITGGHNREFRMPKKKKAVFGKKNKGKGAQSDSD